MGQSPLADYANNLGPGYNTLNGAAASTTGQLIIVVVRSRIMLMRL
jgi:hypothetical protein